MSEETESLGEFLLWVAESYEAHARASEFPDEVDAYLGSAQMARNHLANIASNTLIEEQAARIAGLEDVLEEKRENINSLRVRLSEAVKVLESIMPYACDLSYDTTGSYHADLRAAKAFIATLGENKNE